MKKVVFSRERFLSTVIAQHFGLPDSIMYYISKNPASAKVYQKLIQCCKYFFIKNPILVVHCLQISEGGWYTCSDRRNCNQENLFKAITSRITSTGCRFWVVNNVKVCNYYNNACNSISNFYRCDAKNSWLSYNREMSLEQFLFFTRKADFCQLKHVMLRSDAGVEIPLEEIVALLPLITQLTVYYDSNSNGVSSDTAKKMLQVPRFRKIKVLRLLDVSKEFDVGSIYDYYKSKRSRFTFTIHLKGVLSEEYSKKLDNMVMEILDFSPYKNESPMINYDGQRDGVKKSQWILFKKTSAFFPDS